MMMIVIKKKVVIAVVVVVVVAAAAAVVVVVWVVAVEVVVEGEGGKEIVVVSLKTIIIYRMCKYHPQVVLCAYNRSLADEGANSQNTMRSIARSSSAFMSYTRAFRINIFQATY